MLVRYRNKIHNLLYFVGIDGDYKVDYFYPLCYHN